MINGEKMTDLLNIETEEMHLYTSDEKLKWWGYGEWVEEAEEIKFKYDDYECKVIRIAIEEQYSKDYHVFGGHLCGYVRIPSDHPYHYKTYEDMSIDCHGGLTYGKCHCGHWIGFDCAHCGDYVPSTEFMKKTNDCLKMLNKMLLIPKEHRKFSLFNPVYRNIEYCVTECVYIVSQLKIVMQKAEK